MGAVRGGTKPHTSKTECKRVLGAYCIEVQSANGMVPFGRLLSSFKWHRDVLLCAAAAATQDENIS